MKSLHEIVDEYLSGLTNADDVMRTIVMHVFIDGMAAMHLHRADMSQLAPGVQDALLQLTRMELFVMVRNSNAATTEQMMRSPTGQAAASAAAAVINKAKG